MSFLADLFRDNFRANVTDNPYAIIPNPFYQSSVAGPIKNQTFIYGTDGGDNGQGIPLLPLLQKERDIQVVFVIDGDSSASNNNVTAGQWMYNTYLAAQVHGLDKMPIVPSSAQFLAQELYTRAQFYGCYDQDVATMIYFPNTNETKTMNTQNFFTPVSCIGNKKKFLELHMFLQRS
jgi:lysophospholipase